MPSSATRASVFSERAVVTISSASPWSRAARAIEPPIRPKPISAIRLKCGLTLVTWSHEVTQAVDDQPVGLFRADGHAQRMWELVVAQGTQHQPAFGQERICFSRG